MKHPLHSFVCAALVLVSSGGAQIQSTANDRSTLRVIQTVEPTFPLPLLAGPVLSGNARVALDVDEHGKLTDVIVTGYSRKEFGDAAAEVVRQWKYVPPLHQGQAWASIRELVFEYSRSGVVVNFVGAEAIVNRMDALMEGRHAHRTHALRELDRIPTPIQVVTPDTPPPGPSEGTSFTINVRFYIDEQGLVRLPSVGRDEAGSVYAACALAAIRQWRFDPPTVKGKPVLVLATQQFTFVPKS